MGHSIHCVTTLGILPLVVRPIETSPASGRRENLVRALTSGLNLQEPGPSSKPTLSTISEAALRFLAISASGKVSGLRVLQADTMADGWMPGSTGYSKTCSL